jgi:hypothetical protein
MRGSLERCSTTPLSRVRNAIARSTSSPRSRSAGASGQTASASCCRTARSALSRSLSTTLIRSSGRLGSPEATSGVSRSPRVASGPAQALRPVPPSTRSSTRETRRVRPDAGPRFRLPRRPRRGGRQAQERDRTCFRRLPRCWRKASLESRYFGLQGSDGACRCLGETFQVVGGFLSTSTLFIKAFLQVSR